MAAWSSEQLRAGLGCLRGGWSLENLGPPSGLELISAHERALRAVDVDGCTHQARRLLAAHTVAGQAFLTPITTGTGLGLPVSPPVSISQIRLAHQRNIVVGADWNAQAST